MDIIPILSTLRRHKVAALLIVLEIALAFAIVANALHLIGVRLATLSFDSGLPENELIVINLGGSVPGANLDDLTARDLQALRALPGVKAATITNQYVFGDNSNNSSVRLTPDTKEGGLRVVAANYDGAEDTLKTLGLKLVEGRDFLPEEFQLTSVAHALEVQPATQIIVNQELARVLFPAGGAVGKNVYVGDAPSTIVGVVERLTHPYPGRNDGQGYAMLFPFKAHYRSGAYLVRVDPAQRDSLLKAAVAALDKVEPRRLVMRQQTLQQARVDYYAQDRAMAWLMVGVCVALLVVTALGIVGLASFWVQQRTRMIGTRRALGATAAQIRRYFQLENLLLSSAGIALGAMGAVAISLVLMQHYEMPRLPWWYLLAGAPLLWALGQLAVLAPARRASRLQPVAALRA